LIVTFGYMEEPLLVPVLRAVARAEQIPLDPEDATYYIRHETIVPSAMGSISRIPEAVFSYLSRNAAHEERPYVTLTEQIVDIGTQSDLKPPPTASPARREAGDEGPRSAAAARAASSASPPSIVLAPATKETVTADERRSGTVDRAGTRRPGRGVRIG